MNLNSLNQGGERIQLYSVNDKRMIKRLHNGLWNCISTMLAEQLRYLSRQNIVAWNIFYLQILSKKCKSLSWCLQPLYLNWHDGTLYVIIGAMNFVHSKKCVQKHKEPHLSKNIFTSDKCNLLQMEHFSGKKNTLDMLLKCFLTIFSKFSFRISFCLRCFLRNHETPLELISDHLIMSQLREFKLAVIFYKM